MAAKMDLIKPISKFSNPRHYTKFYINMSATSEPTANPKKATKIAIKETFLTPKFYTTNFDEMETLFNVEINKNLN